MPVRKTQRDKIVQHLHECADNIEKLVKNLKDIAEKVFALKYPELMKDEEE